MDLVDANHVANVNCKYKNKAYSLKSCCQLGLWSSLIQNFPTNTPYQAVFVSFFGRFRTKGRTNRLDGQVVSDEQFAWCANGTNSFFDKQTVWYLAVWKDDLAKTICLSRRTSPRQYGINSHQTDKFQTICSSSSVKTAIETVLSLALVILRSMRPALCQ